MKACLVAVNSKYIHTSPAVDSLRAYSNAAGYPCTVLSFTVNQPEGEILGRLYEARAEAYFFSVYIWNCGIVYRLSRELKKLMPEAEIWYGGPEVSFQSEALLKEHPEVRGIMRGEGEQTFTDLLRKGYGEEKAVPGEFSEPDTFAQIDGISYRRGQEVRESKERIPMDMNDLVFPYYGSEPDPNRIYYYESSRGCPFGCAYCLSSVDRALRFKELPKVFEELGWFLKHKVRQVKFIDRTFNLPSEDDRALEIWKFLKEKDNGVTNFHFEICGELLRKEELEFLAGLRPGQVQFEIGVQTWNPETLAAISRSRDEMKLRKNVETLIEGKNIHIHLDLIAGLPFEDLSSFENSFNKVYAMRPLQLQLGFLKVLKGTPMESFAKEHGFVYLSEAVYEVLSTPWLSYSDVLELKGVEEMVEIYYNSHQFERTVRELLRELKEPYGMYRKLAAFYKRKGYDRMDHSRLDRYRILLEFIEALGFNRENYIPLLLEDALARERLKHWPEWAGKRPKPEGFDYEHRDPLTGNALRLRENREDRTQTEEDRA